MSAECLFHGSPNFVHADRSSELLGEARHSPILNTAWHDIIEQTEVVIDVQGEAVRRDPATAVNADRADLALLFDPYSGEPINASSIKAERCERIDDRFFDRSKEPMKVRFRALKVEHGISHQLAWIVHRRFPTSVDLDDVDTSSIEKLLLRQETSLFGYTTKGDHVWMFAEDQCVRGI